MYIKSFAVIFCALQCLVFALPLTPLGGDIARREYDADIGYRSLYRRAGSSSGGGPIRTPKSKLKAGMNAALATQKVKKPIPHQLSLKESNPGKKDEHWALHVHPTEPNGKHPLHVVHAVSNPAKHGVLETERLKKTPYAPRPGSAPPRHIADFPSKKAAEAAVKEVKDNVHLTQPFPTHNCVDFTCHAVDHLASKGMVQQHEADTFRQYYNEKKEGIRDRTNTDDNRKAAGAR